MSHSSHRPTDSTSHFSDPQRPATAGAMRSTALQATSIGSAQPIYGGQPDLPYQNGTSWSRISSPVSEAYADLVGRGGNLEDVMATLKAGDRTSMRQHIDSKGRPPYYDDQFRGNESDIGSVKERVRKASPVIAELRTNVIIKDEFTLVTDLSYHLARRYNRPTSSIMVRIDHSACLALGGAFDPCYILTITGVPSQMVPAANKRNAALTQSFLADILCVSSDRGVVKYQPVEECNYATNGTTILGQIERLEKLQNVEGAGDSMRRTVSVTNSKSKTGHNHKNIPKMDTTLEMHNGTYATAHVVDNGPMPKELRRKSTSGISQPSASAIPNVFELDGSNRPSTSHGSSSSQNGLRMNGTLKEDLRRTSSGRPNTIAAQEPVPIRIHVTHEAIPKPGRQKLPSSQQPQRAGRQSTKLEPKRSNVPVSPKPQPSSRTTPERSKSGPPPPKTRYDSYLDNVTTSSLRMLDEKAGSKVDARAAETNRQSDLNDNTAAANTAKRRSTAIAAPKIPPPPSVPQTDTGEPKVGKRKSFLAAFRKSTAV